MIKRTLGVKVEKVLVQKSWVTNEMGKSWSILLKEDKCTTFELWDRDTLIGADIGHFIGACYYSATRFFNRNYKNYEPGFVLTFSMLQVLKNCGVELWDLGAKSSIKLMSYKKNISRTVISADFLNQLKALRDKKVKILKTLEIKPLKPEHLIP
eukprot:UN13225